MLAKKAEAAKASLDEAKQSLEQLQEDQTAKVSDTFQHILARVNRR